MNLSKIKELEDLKKELSGLQRRSNKNFERVKSEFFVKGIQEFRDFFKQQGFEIQEDVKIDVNGHENKVVIANYNDFRVDIIIPPADVPYMGAISIWELNVYKSKEKYSLIVNELGRERHMGISSTVYMRELTEDEKIEKEIEEVKERIDMLKEELESGEQIILGFTLLKKENNKKENSYLEYSTQFKSIAELLGHLFS